MTDKNDYFTNSGWFTYPGLAMGREALFYLLARKADVDYDTFMSIGEAIYLLEYMNEKVYQSQFCVQVKLVTLKKS